MIVFIAFGTWGDVLPLLQTSLSTHRLLVPGNSLDDHQLYDDLAVVFVTHAQHQSLIADFLVDSQLNEASISFRYVNSSPIGLNCKDIEEFYSLECQCELFQDLAAMGERINLIVINLFALQGFLLSTALPHAEIIVVHPHFYSSPDSASLKSVCGDSSFKLFTKRCAPSLYKQLYTNPFVDPQYCNHWECYLWPLLSSHYDCIRESLSLPSPLSLNFKLPTMPKAFFLALPSLLFPTIQSNIPQSMFDKLISIVEVCGSIDRFPLSLPSISQRIEDLHCYSINCELHKNTSLCLQFIEASIETEGVICIDFGSMTSIICEKFNIDLLLWSLIHCSEKYSFIWVCHDYAAQISFRFQTLSNANRNIIFISGNAQHHMFLQNCVTMIHHGGSGTISSCLKLGIPQVIIPILHDQFLWASYLAANLNLIPPVIDGIFMQSGCLTPTNAICIAISDALTKSTSSQHRLRCGFLGRKLLNSSSEDGMSVILNRIYQVLSNQSTGCALEMPSTAIVSQSTLPIAFNEFKEFFDNSSLSHYYISCHWETAPSESQFLFEEIFIHKIYSRFVSRYLDGEINMLDEFELSENDIVVDIGANVGMFSLYWELQFESSNALNILAVEPIPSNFHHLQNNKNVYFSDAILVRAAISDIPSDTQPAVDMITFPTCPGNSCCKNLFSDKLLQIESFMNPKVFESQPRYRQVLPCNGNTPSASAKQADLSMTKELISVPNMKTSELLDSYFPHLVDSQEQKQLKYSRTNAVPRIALLKIDVEGNELSVLMGLSKRYWDLIDRIVVEVTLFPESNLSAIKELLLGRGFLIKFGKSEESTNTGCTCVLFGFRL